MYCIGCVSGGGGGGSEVCASFSSARIQLEQQMSVTSPGYGFPSHFSSHSPSQMRTHDYRAARKACVHVYVHALDAVCLHVDQGAMCSGFFLEEHVGG